MSIYLQGLTVEELQSFIKESVKNVILNALNEQKESTNINPSTLLTRKSTASLLGISLVSLDKWSSEGKIQSLRLNTRIRYKMEDVQKFIDNQKDCKD